MANANIVVLVGNVTRDPEVRRVGESSVADIGLAVNESWKDKSGQQQERVVWVDVVVWGRTADVCGEHLRKGAAVLIEGKLQLDEWTDKKTGEKRSKLRVRGERVQFLSRKEADTNRTSAPAAGAANGADNIPF